MSDALSFMLDMATSPAKQIAFAASPEAVLRAAGMEHAHVADGSWVRAAFLADPSPDPTHDPDPADGE